MKFVRAGGFSSSKMRYMSFAWRYFLAMIVAALVAKTAIAATPLSCEALQTRMVSLNTSIKKVSKATASRMQAELDGLSRQYTARCAQDAKATKEGEKYTARRANPDIKVLPATAPPAATPEEEIKRRREAINQKGQQLDGKPSGPGGREIAVQRALPIEGTIQIEGGASSTFYGKVKQEILYTIQEAFVGNLIVTRYYDRAASRYTGREDYAIQTLSTEIDVDHFSGQGCAKYTGSPPTCILWHKLDLWQIVDGEEYPGRADGVVSAGSDSRGVTVNVDGPDIEFFSSQGASVSARSGCGDLLRETVSLDEFKQWLRRGQVRIKRELGTSRPTMPGCRPGSTLTLEMHIGPES